MKPRCEGPTIGVCAVPDVETDDSSVFDEASAGAGRRAVWWSEASSVGTRDVKFMTWSLEWATLTSWRSRPTLRRIETEAAVIAVLAETQLDLARSAFPTAPHPRSGQPGGSKVVVGSRHALELIDSIGSPQLSEHNLVTADTDVPELERFE